ncbi:hypothetical protein FGO68_gene17304 [Halteria grandinella]|uniref:GMP phosphodiesterase delta subunit domain-containing protein n=1 Tax=Halteria grandinella TaxID=5974 RepID=A0A8J8NJJ7_HALGN|nr:hypothetical protein FGO68_gene17304 [Halteria grandinella]
MSTQNNPNQGYNSTPDLTEEEVQRISDGFKIISMKMKNAATGEVLWQCDDWNLREGEVKDVRFPKKILECSEVSRELVFQSGEEIKYFQLLQRIKFHGQEIESLYFRFGFVIPGSTNSWDQVIYADTEGMMPAEVLSGNLVVETLFMSGDTVVHRSFYRIFYE